MYTTTYVFKSLLSTSSNLLCIDIRNKKAVKGNKLCIDNFHGGLSQHWIIDGSGKIRSALNPDLLLHVKSKYSKSVMLWEDICESDNQMWKISEGTKKEIVNLGYPTKCLDVKGEKAKPGTQVIIYNRRKSLNQQWVLLTLEELEKNQTAVPHLSNYPSFHTTSGISNRLSMIFSSGPFSGLFSQTNVLFGHSQQGTSPNCKEQSTSEESCSENNNQTFDSEEENSDSTADDASSSIEMLHQIRKEVHFSMGKYTKPPVPKRVFKTNANKNPCPKCKGFGAYGIYGHCTIEFGELCPTCKGTKYVSSVQHIMCDQCNGQGAIGSINGPCDKYSIFYEKECPKCSGKCYFPVIDTNS